MPYFVSSIIAILSAMTIMLTRYEADDSSITAELESVKSMFSTINGFVNTYIETDGDLTKVNFQELSCGGILLGNIKDTLAATDCATTATADKTTDNVIDSLYESKLIFPKSKVKWQLIPVRDITENVGSIIVHDDAKEYQGVLPLEGFAIGGTDSKTYVRREIVYVVTLKNIKGF